MLPLLVLALEDLKALHKLFDMYLDHMLVEFEQNRMVWLTIFDKVFVAETIV